jgi:hypothetical protein
MRQSLMTILLNSWKLGTEVISPLSQALADTRYICPTQMKAFALGQSSGISAKSEEGIV